MELRDLINFPEKKELPHRFSVDSNCKMQTSAYCIDLGYNQALSEIGDIEVEVDREKLRFIIYKSQNIQSINPDALTIITDAIADNIGEIIK